VHNCDAKLRGIQCNPQKGVAGVVAVGLALTVASQNVFREYSSLAFERQGDPPKVTLTTYKYTYRIIV
jgi:hypothetical protein